MRVLRLFDRDGRLRGVARVRESTGGDVFECVGPGSFEHHEWRGERRGIGCVGRNQQRIDGSSADRGSGGFNHGVSGIREIMICDLDSANGRMVHFRDRKEERQQQTKEFEVIT
jgi:hypothetical protein